MVRASFSPKNAARLVDFLDRHLGAALHLLAVGCVLGGHRPDGGDGDVGERHAGRQSRAQGQRDVREASSSPDSSSHRPPALRKEVSPRGIFPARAQSPVVSAGRRYIVGSSAYVPFDHLYQT